MSKVEQYYERRSDVVALTFVSDLTFLFLAFCYLLYASFGQSGSRLN